MTHDPAPDDEFAELDLDVHARVRAALRDVPPQAAEQADRARETALGHIETASQAGQTRRAKRPIWLTVAAAGIVSLLGVAVLSRGVDAPSTTNSVERSADEAAVAMVQPDARAAAVASVLSESEIDDLVAWVRSSAPVADGSCPVENAEQSYGRRLVNGVDAEVMVDVEAGTVRVVDAATCSVLATATLNP
jgi:hypothetical protein